VTVPCDNQTAISRRKEPFFVALIPRSPLVRILLVEDFEPFRRFIRSQLQLRLDLEVIAEASDGLEAVRVAEQLQPDLILLDIGLPKLNGIEVARRIRKLCPESKIVFLSQESSADVIEEALNSGGTGYVVKTNAGGELLDAIEAMRAGGQFAGTACQATLVPAVERTVKQQ
jgi:DNA-binding NarL/FixJ family response regulator